MLLKPNKKIEKHFSEMLEDGFLNSVIITPSESKNNVVVMKLKKTPLAFIYGWKNDDDYWLVSEN
jgi:hypothetical protein